MSYRAGGERGGARTRSREAGSSSRDPRRRRGTSDLRARLLAAVPAVLFAILIVSQGGLIFTLGVILLGVVALGELYGLMERVTPVKLAGFLALAGLAFAAQYGDEYHVLLVLMIALPLTFFLSLLRPQRENVSWSMAVVLFGVLWVGMAIAHAVLLRELEHGGRLLLDVLIGTFLGDTAAYFGGRVWGKRPLAPQISPNKTVEGLVAGVIGGTLAFWLFAVGYQDWFSGGDALLIGACVAIAAPIGDLFQSLLKRDLQAKDTGRLFGAHGGALDRLDAAFFTIVTAYYVSRAVLG